MKKGILIGIAGASGSGKTLISNTIMDKLGLEKVSLIQEDAYYKDQKNLPLEKRKSQNYDHPDAFDHHLLATHINSLLYGVNISQPIYDYQTHSRSVESKLVKSQPVIIMEGILILNDPKLRDLMDIKVYVDTMPDICFIRRLERDIKERGRDVDSIIAQYRETVRPMYFQFVEPSKRYADLIIPRGGKNLVAIDLLTTKIRDLINTK